jgi:hypothetical protein
MSVAIELRYGVERCGGTFPSDGDVGALWSAREARSRACEGSPRGG